MRIDAHHHFWKYSKESYGWIDDSMAVIRRDFLPADLEAEVRAAGIDGVISVQARQSLEETRWLMQLASGAPWMRGVVGWVPLVDPEVADVLGELSRNPVLRGVRHVLQGEPSSYMARPDFNAGIRTLRDFGLVYDVLVFHHQLPEVIAFVDRHPDQPMILDHCAKPAVRDGRIEPWATQLRELARRPHVTCKLSGLVTEGEYSAWSPESLRPYFDVVLEAFGPRRMLFGTDWPVCLVASSYGRWVDTVTRWIAPLSRAEQGEIMGGTAIRAYGLSSHSIEARG
jgi:L-fuconolactonase